MKKIRVAIADDQVLFVDSLKTVLELGTSDIDVVGVEYDGQGIIDKASIYNPDIILMDVRMPKVDGVQAARIIRSKYPNIKIIMLTTFDYDEYIFEALHYGAEGYLLKNIPTEELVTSIRAIYNGTYQLSPSIADKVITKAYDLRSNKNNVSEQNLPSWYKKMSNREKEILSLLSKGYSNKKIAESLFVAEQTVKNYVRELFNKMDVSNRTEASKKYYELEKNLF